MTKRIFRSVFLTAFAVMLACIALIVGALYSYFSARQEAQLVHQESKAAGQGPGLAGACPGDDPDISLCGSNGPALSIVEAG